MFISATRMRRNAAFSRGSRWRERLGARIGDDEEEEERSGRTGGGDGVPSGWSQIGGEEAVEERKGEGMQVWS